MNCHRKESSMQNLPPWSETLERKGLFHRSVTDPHRIPIAALPCGLLPFALFWSPFRAGPLSRSRDVLLLFHCVIFTRPRNDSIWRLRSVGQCFWLQVNFWEQGSDCRWALSCARIPTGPQLSCSEKGIDSSSSSSSSSMSLIKLFSRG